MSKADPIQQVKWLVPDSVRCCSCLGKSWCQRAFRRSIHLSCWQALQREAPPSSSSITWGGRAAWHSPPSSTSRWLSWQIRKRFLRLDQSSGGHIPYLMSCEMCLTGVCAWDKSPMQAATVYGYSSACCSVSSAYLMSAAVLPTSSCSLPLAQVHVELCLAFFRFVFCAVLTRQSKCDCSLHAPSRFCKAFACQKGMHQGGFARLTNTSSQCLFETLLVEPSAPAVCQWVRFLT